MDTERRSGRSSRIIAVSLKGGFPLTVSETRPPGSYPAHTF
jgi:hypothetical protein